VLLGVHNVRPFVRFIVGATLGLAAIAVYLSVVGVTTVLDRATTLAPVVAILVLGLVLVEGAADGIGVWASVRPLNGGISPSKSVQFAFAGDFFDTLSPAGPVTSEPIMARFFAVETETSYSEALGVRGVAKYVKSGAQRITLDSSAGAALGRSLRGRVARLHPVTSGDEYRGIVRR